VVFSTGKGEFPRRVRPDSETHQERDLRGVKNETSCRWGIRRMKQNSRPGKAVWGKSGETCPGELEGEIGKGRWGGRN